MTFRRTLHAGLAVLLVLVIAGAAGFGRAATPVPPRQLPLRVLFIGNSQTSTNDLPAFVAEIAKESKHGKVTYHTIAPSAVTLGGLWNGRGNPAYIDGRWDAVVLQQGPSVTPDRRAELCFYATEWSDWAREQGARPYLLMVWPRRGSELSEVVASYAAAASVSGATLLPAGSAWGAVQHRVPGLPLYRWDGVHPSRLGTYLAALVVYAGVRRIPPVAPNAVVVAHNPFWIPMPTARLFRTATAEALTTRYPAPSCSGT